MTLAEMMIYFDCYEERESVKAKEIIVTNYNLAYSIALFINNSLNGESIPTINDLYPEMFGEAVKNEEKPVMDYNLIRIKEQLLDFAESHNKKNKTEK